MQINILKLTHIKMSQEQQSSFQENYSESEKKTQPMTEGGKCWFVRNSDELLRLLIARNHKIMIEIMDEPAEAHSFYNKKCDKEHRALKEYCERIQEENQINNGKVQYDETRVLIGKSEEELRRESELGDVEIGYEVIVDNCEIRKILKNRREKEWKTRLCNYNAILTNQQKLRQKEKASPAHKKTQPEQKQQDAHKSLYINQVSLRIPLKRPIDNKSHTRTQSNEDNNIIPAKKIKR